MENRKLSQEQLQEISQIQQQLQLAQLEVGKIEMQKVAMINYVNQIQQAQSDLVKSLEELYGAGTINLQTGEFIPDTGETE